MFAELDRVLEPEALAARGWRLEAEEPLSRWPRLAALEDPGAARSGDSVPQASVRVQAAFGVRPGRVAVLEASLSATLRCLCQRCLEPMRLRLDTRSRLAFGGDEAGSGLQAEGFEDCELEPGTTLRQLLEDELLLAMPAFPAHIRREECGSLADQLDELAPAERGDEATSPFAVLAGLKRTD